MSSIVLTDSIITALARLVDDAQTGSREPSHSTLDFHIARAGLKEGDPNNSGKPVGKFKRVRGVLSWALENEPEAGERFAITMIAALKGCGGFRESSPNYVGTDTLQDAIAALRSEGYELSSDGDLRSILLDNLSGVQLTSALRAYVRRAQRGALDAALVTGTGKDLLEATSAHVLFEKFGTQPTVTNFPTLLGQAFIAVGLNTSSLPGQTAANRLEASLYELGCAVNQLRNKQGTGHGRPFLPTITDVEARTAVESMGLIAERLLAAL